MSTPPSLLERVEKYGGQLWTLNRGRIADGMWASMLGMIAAEDHKKILGRFAAGLRVAISQGRFPRLPYGYRRVGRGVWVIDDDQAETIRLIFRLYLQDVSLHLVAVHLNDAGVATRYNRKWTASHIRWILRNPIYAGAYVFSRKRRGRRAQAQPTIVVEAPHLRIVDLDQFVDVKAKMNTRATREPDAGVKHQHYSLDFLKGRVNCEHCEKPMIFSRRNDGQRRMICNDPAGCPLPSHHVPLDVLRDAVLDAIERRLVSPEADALFDEAVVRRRERSRKALVREKLSVTLKLKNANDKADETMDEAWMAGSAPDRRNRLREERETAVTKLEDQLNLVRRRERLMDEGGAVRETLVQRFGRFRSEGVPEGDPKAAYELVHALRNVLASVRLSIDRPNSSFDVRVEIAPNGDAQLADAKPGKVIVFGPDAVPQEPVAPVAIDTVTEDVRIFMRAGRKVGDEYMNRVHAALERGWLPISDDDYHRLEDLTPALGKVPASWTIETRIALVRGMLVCHLTNLPVQKIDQVCPTGAKQRLLSTYRPIFATTGGLVELRDALVALQLPGLPSLEGRELLPDCHHTAIVRWSPEW